MIDDFYLFIFDWSGVISDDRKAVWQSNMRVLREYGKLDMTFEQWLSNSSGNAVDFFRS